MRFLLLSVFLVVFTSYGQRGKPKVSYFPFHSIAVSPLSVTFNERDFFWGQFIRYEYTSRRNFYINATTSGSFIKALDGRKKYFDRNNDLFPFYNNSYLSVGKLYRLKLNDRPGSIRVGPDFGLEYLQFGSNFSVRWDYWTTDTTGGIHKIKSGFREFNLRVGTQIRFSRVWNCHSLKFNMLWNAHTIIRMFNTNNADFYTVYEDSQLYPIDRFGFRADYRYTRELKNENSIGVEIGAMYIPFIEYKPNPDIFVARGSESLDRLFLSATVFYRWNDW